MAKIETPHELFVHELGAALTMEQTSLEMLGKLQEKASNPKLQRQLRLHRQETVQQIQNLRRTFEALGKEPDPQTSQTIEGLEKEGEQKLEQVDGQLVDSVILHNVVEAEHYEIGVYDGLIIMAETSGEEDLVPLFQENLEQEKRMLDEAIRSAEQLSYHLGRQFA